jgi:hypothetical protein
MADISVLVGFVCARALRAPVFLGPLTHKTGRCAPPALPIAASLIRRYTPLPVCGKIRGVASWIFEWLFASVHDFLYVYGTNIFDSFKKWKNLGWKNWAFRSKQNTFLHTYSFTRVYEANEYFTVVNVYNNLFL